MASAAQVAANRENAKRPRTLSEEAKESLRTRALKHGLAAKLDANIVIKGEDKQEFEAIRDALLSDAALGTPQEILLIKLQAEGFWKLQRAGRMETGAMDLSLAAAEIKGIISRDLKDENLGAALAMALREQTAWFDRLRRYSTTAERAFFRATRELAMIRKAGPQEPIGYVPQPANQEESAQAAPEIGCVLQQAVQPEFDGLFPGQILKLEAMSEAESFAFLDELTAPTGQTAHPVIGQVHGKSCR